MMVWSLQLVPWALPGLLALLLLAREWAFLWPRRRESGSVALLALAALSGTWVVLQLFAMTVPDQTAKVVAYRAELVAAALVPVSWLVFCLVVSGRVRHLRGPAAVLLYTGTLVTLVLALGWGDLSLLVDRTYLEVHAERYLGLEVAPGWWYWVHLGLRTAGVLVGSAAVIRYLLRIPATRPRAVLPALAAILALAPGVVQVTDLPLEPWRDLTAPAMGLAVTLLGWGVLRHRLLNLGPVARTLVMVELRDPLVVLDGRGRIVDLNRAAERILGLEVYGDVPVSLGTLWAAARERADRYARITLPVQDGRGPPGGDGGPEEDGEGVDTNPPRRIFEATLTPLGRKDRTGGHTALLLRDITARDRAERELRETTRALRSANQELERLAHTDPLTELANRRHFMEALESELERSERYDRPLSLVLLDLDHFKAVNDTWGHAAGDSVLQATADVMRSVCRDVDLPARLGGEELAILLPETRAEGALALAERIRVRLEGREHTTTEGQTFQVTASLGVTTRRKGERSSPGGFLRRADAALYEAKEAGRNRVASAFPRTGPE